MRPKIVRKTVGYAIEILRPDGWSRVCTPANIHAGRGEVRRLRSLGGELVVRLLRVKTVVSEQVQVLQVRP